jgi:hypothetical protein
MVVRPPPAPSGQAPPPARVSFRKLLRVTKGTLREWRRLKKGPAYIRASKAVFYMRADIKAWLERQKVSHDQVPA